MAGGFRGRWQASLATCLVTQVTSPDLAGEGKSGGGGELIPVLQDSLGHFPLCWHLPGEGGRPAVDSFRDQLSPE